MVFSELNNVEHFRQNGNTSNRVVFNKKFLFEKYQPEELKVKFHEVLDKHCASPIE